MRHTTKLIPLILMLALPVYAGGDQYLDRATEAFRSGDYATAVRYFRKMADDGDAEAQFMLTTMYAKGMSGVEQDVTEARKWLHVAAENGSLRAQELLSKSYEVGSLGLTRDKEKAQYWRDRMLQSN